MQTAGRLSAGWRCSSKVWAREKKPLQRFLQLLGSAESDLLRCLDLDGFARCRVAAHASRALANLQRAAYEKFPTVTVINLADALQLIQEVVDQIAVVIRFLSAFAILAGVIILASAVAGTRFRRVREVVILKTLGATRQHIAKIFSVEFLTLGAVAGFLGSLMASVFASLMLTRFLDATFQFDIRATLVATAVTALLANASGWMASWRILGQKPLEVLRED